MDGLRAAGLQGSASRARGRESFIASLAYAWGGPQAGPAGSGQSVALTTAQWFVRQGHLDETRIQSRAQTLLPEVLAVPDAERALDLGTGRVAAHGEQQAKNFACDVGGDLGGDLGGNCPRIPGVEGKRQAAAVGRTTSSSAMTRKSSCASSTVSTMGWKRGWSESG